MKKHNKRRSSGTDKQSRKQNISEYGADAALQPSADEEKQNIEAYRVSDDEYYNEVFSEFIESLYKDSGITDFDPAQRVSELWDGEPVNEPEPMNSSEAEDAIPENDPAPVSEVDDKYSEVFSDAFSFLRDPFADFYDNMDEAAEEVSAPAELSASEEPDAPVEQIVAEEPNAPAEQVAAEVPEAAPEAYAEPAPEEVQEIPPEKPEPVSPPRFVDPVASILASLDSVGSILSDIELNADLLSGFSLSTSALDESLPESTDAVSETSDEDISSVDDLVEQILAEQRQLNEEMPMADSEPEDTSMEDYTPIDDTPVIDPIDDFLSSEFATYHYTHTYNRADFESVLSDEVLSEQTRQTDETDDLLINDVDAEDALYAENGDYSEDDSPAETDNKQKTDSEFAAKVKKFASSVKNTTVKALAYIGMRLSQAKVSLRNRPSDDEDLGAEFSPENAAKFYDSHLSWLRLRSKLAFVFAVVLMYLSFGLPVFGALRDTGVKSAVCLILLLGSMLAGLDIITSGIMSLVRRRPDANSLIALSAFICVIDAFIIASGHKDDGLPFCVIPALTIAFSLLGSVMHCRSSRIAFNTAASTRNYSTLIAEPELTDDGITLIKTKRSTANFVRRIEEAGPDETVYGTMAPYLIISALVLSIIAAAVSRNFAGYAHILSGMMAAAAPVAMLIAFPLPFFISAKGLIRNGSAIAGWSGLYDIGNGKDIVIEDKDLFPKGTVKIEKIKLLSGANSKKIISYAGSVIAASGSILAPAFKDVMKKGNGTLMTVDEFTVHESGGLIAMIDGELVHCGDAAFMQLMHIRLPHQLVRDNRVYIAADNALCGMFDISYTVSDASKRALYSLINSKQHPVFALRDFNMTNKMLSLKYDTATDGFDFPAFTDRYKLSCAEPSEDGKPSAIISREGLAPLVSLAEHGNMLYRRIRLCVWLSVLCTVIGMLAMLVVSMFTGVGAMAALIYMLVWLIPVVILSFTINIP